MADEITNTRNSKIAVGGLLLTIALGAGVWGYLEFSSDLLLNRDKAMKFAAEYEKRCQGTFEPTMCRRLAGMNHGTCMHDAAMASQGDESKELPTYLECMMEKQSQTAL